MRRSLVLLFTLAIVIAVLGFQIAQVDSSSNNQNGTFTGQIFQTIRGFFADIFGGGDAEPLTEPQPSLEILKKRYAKGEISKEEFDNIKKDVI